MNSLKKALASLFVLATIFVVFSCSNASDSDEKSDGNPFKGTTWEGGGMSLTFIDSDTCVLDYGVSSYARAAISSGTEYSYTWEENEDGSYTATLKIVGSDAVFATFTIDSSGAVSGTFSVGGQKISFTKKVDSEIEIDSDGDGYPFAGTKWIGTGEAEGEEYSFGKTTVIENDASEFFYISKQDGEGYTASIGLTLLGEWKEIYTLTVKSADAKEGVFDYQGFKVTYKRTK